MIRSGRSDQAAGRLSMRPSTYLVFGAALVVVVLVACARQAEAPPPPTIAPTTQAVDTTPPSEDLALTAFTKGGCGACHIIPGVPNARGTIGPDLTNISQGAALTLQSSDYTGKAKTIEEYLIESILEPDLFISTHCAGGPCQKGIMPASLGQSLP
jgi:hypothetical protein